MKDDLLYPDEHTSCFWYDNSEEPILILIDKTKGEIFQVNKNHNRIFFLLKGKINFLENVGISRILDAGSFMLLPRGHEYALNIEENSSLLIMLVDHKINVCEHFSLVMLHQLNKNLKNYHSTIHPLTNNQVISDYLSNTVTTLSAGLKCKSFHDIKQRELLFYLRAYYPKNDLVAFFAPMLNDDIDFVELIYQNYELTKTLSDLANITHYSLSGFKKRFSKIFDMPPHIWMEKEKAKKIHDEINCTQKSFKEIAAKYDFHSPPHFTRFCNKMYGMSPAKLRKKTRCSILDIEILKPCDG